MRYVDGSILLLSLGIALCSLIGVFFIYIYSRRIKQKCNSNMMKSIREQDRVTKELERTRIEKETIEKLLKDYWDSLKRPLTKKNHL